MSNVVSLRPPKYCHHKASGQAVVSIRGRDVYLGKFGSAKSKELYRRLIAEYLLTGGVESLGGSESATVAEVMAPYLRFAMGYYRKGGKPTREYELAVECCRFIKPLYGRSSANEFGPLALKAVRQRMIDAGHCRTNINKNVDRIRRMFKWAAAEQLIPAAIPQALAMVPGLRRGKTEARETDDDGSQIQSVSEESRSAEGRCLYSAAYQRCARLPFRLTLRWPSLAPPH